MTQILWPHASFPLELAEDEAHVWVVALDASQTSYDEHWTTLTRDERDRASDFRFDEPRRRFVIARGALRKLLSGYLGAQPAEIALTLDPHGKPRLANDRATARLNFNVSHSGELALIAIASECDVGVDIERLRDVEHMEHIARRFFHPSEVAALHDASATQRSATFMQIWTGKEAVLKAFGTGITGSLTDFQIPLGGSGPGWVACGEPAAGGRSQCWLHQLTPCDGYRAAVACINNQRRARCIAYSP